MFERWFFDIEQLQSHPLRQFLVTYQRCRVTNMLGTLDTEIDLAGSQGLEGMKVEMTKAYKNIVYLLPKLLRGKLAKLHVLAFCSELTVLTQEPAASFGVKVESPSRLALPRHQREWLRVGVYCCLHTGMWTRVAPPWFWRLECHAPACSLSHEADVPPTL